MFILCNWLRKVFPVGDTPWHCPQYTPKMSIRADIFLIADLSLTHHCPIVEPSLSHRCPIAVPSSSHQPPIKSHKGIQTPSGQSPSFICLISSTGPHFQGTDPNYEKTFPFSQRSPNTLPTLSQHSPNTLPTPHISIFSVNSCFWKCAYPHPKRTPLRDFLSTKKIPYKILFRYLIRYSLYSTNRYLIKVHTASKASFSLIFFPAV